MVKLQYLLNNEINKIYKNFKPTISLKLLDELKQRYYKTSRSKDVRDQMIYPLISYIIKDNELEVEAEFNKTIYNKDRIKELTDERIDHVFKLFNNTLIYAKEKKYKIPDTTIYIWISDRVPWYNDIDQHFPIFIFAKPRNSNFLIFPDNTFDCLTIDQKYRGDCKDWDSVKKLIIDNCSELKFEKKINKIFFKGTSTTKTNSKIRENLEDFSKKNNKWLDVKLDAWQHYMRLDNFCKYKFLLNLPGHYPWSNRFKYLFLMKSIVINVDVYTIDIEGAYSDLPWDTFINYIVEPKKHYINLEMKYYVTTNKELNEKCKKMNMDENLIIFDKLKKIYNNSNHEKMINKSFKRVSKLKNKHVYEYIYNCILMNSKIEFV